jgi:heme exporter protein B
MSFAIKVSAILWKDVLSELRAREIVTSVLVFGLLVLVVFNFAFDPGSGTMAIVGAGILWVAFTFAGVLALNRSFAMENENSCIDGLMLCPVDRQVLYLGKLAGCFTFMLLVEIIITPVFLVLFNQSLWMPRLGLVIVLATVGFAAVGTLFSALAANTKARDIMLPILFLPMIVPVIIAAVEATGIVLDGGTWSDMATWLWIILAFDVIFLAVSTLVFEFVLEE